MRITVDLAAKFSAVCVMDEHHEVHCEFDSRGKSSFQFADEIREAVVNYRPEFVLVEDVPYGISSQAMVKPVLRLQGIVGRELAQVGMLDKTLFLNPSTWQKKYPGVARGPKPDREEAARSAAVFYGYNPPDLIGQYVATLEPGVRVLKKHTEPLHKTMTDYIDAYLMARWSYDLGSFAVHAATKGLQPFYI